MILQSKSMDKESFEENCEDVVVLVVTPLVKLLGVDVSPFPPVEDSLRLWPVVSLEEGMDG